MFKKRMCPLNQEPKRVKSGTIAMIRSNHHWIFTLSRYKSTILKQRMKSGCFVNSRDSYASFSDEQDHRCRSCNEQPPILCRLIDVSWRCNIIKFVVEEVSGNATHQLNRFSLIVDKIKSYVLWHRWNND